MFLQMLASKIAPSAKATAVLAAVVAFVQQYIFNDWDFVIFLAIFIALDTATGMAAAFKNNKLNSKKMAPLVGKVLGYAALLVLTHGLTKFTVHGAQNFAFKLIDYVVYSYLMGREALSIIENLTMIDPKIVPASLRKRLEQAMQPEAVELAVAASTSPDGTATATATVTTVPTPTPEETEPAPVVAAG